MTLQAILQNSARALELYSSAIEVSSHNVSNANTPGYIRDELSIGTAGQYTRGRLTLGTGVAGQGVQQQFDRHLENRLHTATGEAAWSSTRLDILAQLETQVGELGDNDLSTALSDMVNAFDELATQPSDASLRSIAVGRAEAFAQTLTGLRTRIDNLILDSRSRQDALVEEANTIVQFVYDSTVSIRQAEAESGFQSEARALRTERANALNRLSELIPVEFREHDDGTVSLSSGGTWLILGGEVQTFEQVTDPNLPEDARNVVFTRTRNTLPDGEGELPALVSAVDDVLGGAIADLDRWAAEIIQSLNSLHASGEGLTGHTAITAAHGVTDPTAVLSDAGLPFDVTHGSFELHITDQSSGQRRTTRITVDLDGLGADTTLDDLVASISAVDGVTASRTPEGRLTITADAGSEFAFGDDSSGFLVAAGVNAFFHGTDSGSIGVDPNLLADPSKLATGSGGGPGDNTTILAMAAFEQDARADLGGASVREFYRNFVGGIAREAAEARTSNAALVEFRVTLQTQRERISGVNVDEELINLLTFQKNYQAVARVTSVARDLLDTLINL